ncbi:hypothetical protein CIG75_12650 [Tumebacillus algifaecis]|uniref:SIR2-like domain-containing protein n=1 Tax=Tumebacillus algifaecis TaxID=1214604 RepID=A0A223D266_9BACL|nr:hypothetical protein [Tumebacillus algifaecis]ASS75748.1 hypothetical protein CIG75_12650 [Tumebacillus algifaecis]
MPYTRDLEDVVVALKKAKREGTYVNLLIGAGCSVTAGIPAAAGILDAIEEAFPREYKRVEQKDYATCMSKLTTRERKSLISDFVNNASLNWTHITIAHLMKSGFINRVLTTNFDNLILRACALLDVYPAIYDLATSKDFRSDLLLEDKSVFHLHGQHTGFILCNTEDEVQEQFDNLKPIYDHLKQNSMWIIVGYSGLNDSVFQLLETENSFEHRLFWVGYKDSEPAPHLTKNLIQEKNYAFYVKGYDSDSFFVSLARQLEKFPPEFIVRPFSHLSKLLENVQYYTLPLEETMFKLDALNASTTNIVKEAVQRIENDSTIMATHLLNAGLHAEFFKLLHKCGEDERKKILEKFDKTIKGTIAVHSQNVEKMESELERDENNVQLLTDIALDLRRIGMLGFSFEHLERACKYYEKATSIDAENSYLFTEWGSTLITFSRMGVEVEKANEYLIDAIDKFEKALELIDEHDVGVTREIIQIKAQLFSLKADEGVFDADLNDYIIRNIEDNLEHFTKDSEIMRILAISYMNRANEIGDETPEEAEEFLERSFATLIQAREILPIPHDLQMMSECLQHLVEILPDGFQSDSFDRNYRIMRDALLKEMDEISEFEEDSLAYQDVKPGIQSINSLAYVLINKLNFVHSKELLEMYLDARPSDPFPIATLGLWFFKNTNIDNAIALKQGVHNYSKAIEAAKEQEHPHTDAIQQKLYVESAKFLLRRELNKKDALESLLKAFEMGVLEDYPSLFVEVQVMMTELNQELEEDTLKETAAATTPPSLHPELEVKEK